MAQLVKTVDSNAITQFPDGVVDTDAYESYLEYKKRTQEHRNRYFQTSEEGLIIDLGAYGGFEYSSRPKIKHLPIAEQNKAKAAFENYKRLIGKMSTWKRKAFKIPINQVQDSQILDLRSTEVFELFARMYSVDEVHQIINQQWDVTVQRSTIETFRRIHLGEIRERQIEKSKNLDDIRLGWKKSRLEELSSLYMDRKAKYVTSRSPNEYKLLLQTIEQIRREVEGDKFTIEADMTLKIEETINYHINQELMKNLNILQIVLARVGSRQQLSPLYLLYRLQNSFYAKHTGFKGIIKEDEEIELPSRMVYDFDELGRLNEQFETNDLALQKSLSSPRVLTNEEPILDNFAQKLMIKLKSARQDVNEAQYVVEEEEQKRSSEAKTQAEQEWKDLLSKNRNSSGVMAKDIDLEAEETDLQK